MAHTVVEESLIIVLHRYSEYCGIIIRILLTSKVTNRSILSCICVSLKRKKIICFKQMKQRDCDCN